MGTIRYGIERTAFGGQNKSPAPTEWKNIKTNDITTPWRLELSSRALRSEAALEVPVDLVSIATDVI